ncbi:MAG: hypothetical protein ACR2NR_00655 [Solirubrobacteraceae bacterium]
MATEAEQRDGILRSIRVRDLDLARELRAVHARRTPPTGLARQFWGWLETHPAARL